MRFDSLFFLADYRSLDAILFLLFFIRLLNLGVSGLTWFPVWGELVEASYLFALMEVWIVSYARVWSVLKGEYNGIDQGKLLE